MMTETLTAQTLQADIDANLRIAGQVSSIGFVATEFINPLIRNSHIEVTPGMAEHADWFARVMEAQQFARRAPRFDEQLRDETRTNALVAQQPDIVNDGYAGWADKRVTPTEHEAMVELAGYLDEIIADARMFRGSVPPYVLSFAESARKNLTFIGEKEFAEAAAGMASLWKTYLDLDERNTLTVLTNINHRSSYHCRKSDEYLRDRVLDNFTDEELETYGPRIRNEIDPQAKPKHSRIIILDDWMVSGAQITRKYRDFHAYNPLLAPSLEINVITANRKFIEDGLQLDYSPGQVRPPTPVKAYFLAHDAEDNGQYSSHITGSHSTVDYAFQTPIMGYVHHLKWAGLFTAAKPALAGIIRQYYAEPSWYSWGEDGTITRHARTQNWLANAGQDDGAGQQELVGAN